jgi:predicted lipid-binding transport protein (Tim44 family)
MSDNPRDDLIDVLETISKAQLSALRRLRQSVQQKPAPGSAGPSKRMSYVQMVYDILRRAGHPLHISEILSLVAKRHGVKLDRESIVSALAKRVARKDRFVRTAPNTFSLLPEIDR